MELKFDVGKVEGIEDKDKGPDWRRSGPLYKGEEGIERGLVVKYG